MTKHEPKLDTGENAESCTVRISDTDRVLESRGSDLCPAGLVTHPISNEDARAHYRGLVGRVSDRIFATSARRLWDRLVQADTPEERLTCERLIRAAYICCGLNAWKEGSDLARENARRSAQEFDEAMNERGLARWRGVRRSE